MTVSVDQIAIPDLDELIAFASGYQREGLKLYPALPHPEVDALHNSFTQRLEHGTGVVAREGGEVVGCLFGYGPITDLRPGHIGMYAPLNSCLVAGSNVDRTFTALLTELGNLPALSGVQVTDYTCWPQHPALNASLVQNGYGLRCADAVVRIADVPAAAPDTGLTIEEVALADVLSLQEVKQTLARHLSCSPVWQEEFQFTPEFVRWKSDERQSVHFAARDGERIIGFIEATYEGENYLTGHPTMRNICGAGVQPEYRGRGVMRALLSALAEKYRGEGITVLGVDYETQNPQARGFWESIFTPYTWSWERHFDRPWGPL